MKVHPLRQAYNKAVKSKYNVSVWGDKNPNATELAARRVNRLGVSYDDFVDLALTIWDDFATRKGWQYPYWNCIISKSTFERVEKLLQHSNDEETTDRVRDDYEYELDYATHYIAWMLGEIDKRPTRLIDTSSTIRIKAASTLCTLYGVKLTTSNYNRIAMEVKNARCAL